MTEVHTPDASRLLPRPLALPDFPWDSLTAYRARAAQHPDGVVDLAVGTPVDPTPQLARQALAGAADAPGYPTAIGTRRCARPSSAGWRDGGASRD